MHMHDGEAASKRWVIDRQQNAWILLYVTTVVNARTIRRSILCHLPFSLQLIMSGSDAGSAGLGAILYVSFLAVSLSLKVQQADSG